jgi:hypothetical protein
MAEAPNSGSEKDDKQLAKEAGRKNFVLRIRADLFDKLEAWAQDDFRSTNAQVEYLISEALKKAGRLKTKN